jgi:hypothetical protein
MRKIICWLFARSRIVLDHESVTVTSQALSLPTIFDLLPTRLWPSQPMSDVYSSPARSSFGSPTRSSLSFPKSMRNFPSSSLSNSLHSSSFPAFLTPQNPSLLSSKSVFEMSVSPSKASSARYRPPQSPRHRDTSFASSGSSSRPGFGSSLDVEWVKSTLPTF